MKIHKIEEGEQDEKLHNTDGRSKKRNRDTGDRGCCEERTYDVRGADEAGTQHAADSLRIQAGMIPVCANGYFTLCYQLHQRLGRHMFFLRNSLAHRSCYENP